MKRRGLRAIEGVDRERSSRLCGGVGQAGSRVRSDRAARSDSSTRRDAHSAEAARAQRPRKPRARYASALRPRLRVRRARAKWPVARDRDEASGQGRRSPRYRPHRKARRGGSLLAKPFGVGMGSPHHIADDLALKLRAFAALIVGRADARFGNTESFQALA